MTNSDLQKDVQDAIRWEPTLHTAEIGVTVKDGIVTLTGVVDRYTKKITAENAAKNVIGVKAVVEDIVVSYGPSFNKTDTEIAAEILDAWKWNWEVPDEKIKVKVEKGWVTLEGDVHWNYQKEEAKNSIKHLPGVKEVTNYITVKSKSTDFLEKSAVQNALARNWAINSNEIKVDVISNKVKLRGTVHSLYQKEEAGRLAWNAPGVRAVDNELAVIY